MTSTRFSCLHALSIRYALVILLAACAAPPPPAPAPVVAAPAMTAAPPEPAAPVAAQAAAAPTPEPAPIVEAPSPGALALAEGVKAFEQGEFRRAETRLGDSLRLGGLKSPEQVQAHKTLAFVYCITRRAALCEKSFQVALALDPSFELSRAERGHPVWGPVFARVKRQQK